MNVNEPKSEKEIEFIKTCFVLNSIRQVYLARKSQSALCRLAFYIALLKENYIAEPHIPSADIIVTTDYWFWLS